MRARNKKKPEKVYYYYLKNAKIYIGPYKIKPTGFMPKDSILKTFQISEIDNG